MRPRTIAALLCALALPLSAGAAAQVPTPVTPLGQISSTGSPLDFSTGAEAPVLAYDPVSGRVLALWHVRGRGDTRSVRGRVLDARGRPRGSQFELPGFVATTTQIAVAARPRGGGWVVAAGVEVAVRATRIVTAAVARNGVPGRRRGISATAPFADAGVASPAIAFDPRGGRGVIAWFLDAQRARGGAFARGVDADGRPTAPVRAIFRPPKQALSIDGRLALSFHPGTRRWLVAWRQFLSLPARPARNLFARRVLGNGRPRGPVHALGAAGSSGAPVLVPGGGGPHTLALYSSDDGDGHSFLHVLPLGTGGAPFGGRRTVSVTQEPIAAASPSVVRVVRRGLLLAYVRACEPVGHEACPQFAPVVGRALNRFGAPERAARVIVAEAVGHSATLVATGTRGSLLAWEGATLSGPPTFSDDAMRTVFPHKSEIFVRPLPGRAQKARASPPSAGVARVSAAGSCRRRNGRGAGGVRRQVRMAGISMAATAAGVGAAVAAGAAGGGDNVRACAVKSSRGGSSPGRRAAVRAGRSRSRSAAAPSSARRTGR